MWRYDLFVYGFYVITFYLFCEVLLHLRQPLGSSPEAEDLVLRAVRHVDELLEEPAVRDGTGDGSNDEAVLADLDEGHAAARVFPRVHDEGLATHLN